MSEASTAITTPLSSAECAEIALEALTSFTGPADYATNLQLELVRVDPETGDWLGTPTARSYWGAKGGIAYPHRTPSTWPEGAGREFGVSTSVRFANGTTGWYAGTFTVRSVWIRCTPFAS